MQLSSVAADPQRQAEVARLAADVMPSGLKATTHIFTETDREGVQRVIAKNAADEQQVKCVRAHLLEVYSQVLKGYFSGSTHIHGAQMSGLGDLMTSKSGQIRIDYEDVEAGAELNQVTSDVRLVNALHQWFEAHLVDNGSAVMAGHSQHLGHGSMPKQ